MEARHNGVVDVVLGHAGGLEGVGEGLAGQGDVHLLAEALLPDVRVHLTGNPPAVEELVAGRTPPDELGHRAVDPAEERHPAVARVPLLGPAGQAGAEVRHHGQGPARRRGRECHEHRADGGPGGAAEVVGTAVAPEAEGGVHDGRAGLVEVAGGRRGEQDVLGRRRCCGEGAAGGFDPQRGRVLVVGGHGAGPLARPRAQHLGDGGTLQPPVGQVGAP